MSRMASRAGSCVIADAWADGQSARVCASAAPCRMGAYVSRMRSAHCNQSGGLRHVRTRRDERAAHGAAGGEVATGARAVAGVRVRWRYWSDGLSDSCRLSSLSDLFGGFSLLSLSLARSSPSIIYIATSLYAPSSSSATQSNRLRPFFNTTTRSPSAKPAHRLQVLGER